MRFTSRWNWNLEMLVSREEGKPENLEKNPQSKDTGTGNRTRATLVGGKHSHTAPSLLPII